LLPIWGFIAVTLPLVATPGVSTAVVLRNSIGGGTRVGVLTALGCNLGNLSYGILTAFGFGVALQRWPSVWLVLRAAGVIYLAWLGARSLLHAVRAPAPTARAVPPPDGNGLHSVSAGFFANVLNPSLVAFYLVIVPQFIPRDAPFARSALTLSAVHVSLAFPWHCVWAVAGSTMAMVLGSGTPRRVLDVLTGVALLWLALKVAF
jgi:threonine/homoserine/homoserine lactone efflux protein